MKRYAIYSYEFKKTRIEGNLLSDSDEGCQDTSDAHCRTMLNQLFSRSIAPSDFIKQKKSDADKYPCTVLVRKDDLVWLRIENPKEGKVYVKDSTLKSAPPRIDERLMPSNPYIYIFIDCRECSNKIAISTDSSAWRNTDIVADLLRSNINRLFENHLPGISIEIKPELLQIDFVSHSRKLIKKNHLSLNKMTIHFTRGTINPKVEEIVRNDPYIKRLQDCMFDAKRGQLTLDNPDTQKVFDDNSKTLEHIVALVMSNTVSEPFRLQMMYSDGSSYNCGKDIRMEFIMDETTLLSINDQESLFSEYTIEGWFDSITQKIDEQRHGEYSK